MSHAQREKQRREKQALLIEELRQIVPPPPHQQLLGPDQRPKYIVLLDTIKCITDLRKTVQHLKTQIASDIAYPLQDRSRALGISDDLGVDKQDQEFHSKVIQIASASQSQASWVGLQRGMSLPIVRVHPLGCTQQLQVNVAALPQATTLTDLALALFHCRMVTIQSKIDSQVTNQGTVLILTFTVAPTREIPPQQLGSYAEWVRSKVVFALDNRLGQKVDFSRAKVSPRLVT